MAQTYSFYNDRACEAAREAQTAVLANVRERALRSEKAWREMAERALKIEQDRDQARIARAERDALQVLAD